MITESLYHFYSHAREGRDEAQKKGVVKIMNFYSHAREGRDEWGKIKGEIRDALDEFLWKKIKRKPVIIPIIMEV